MLYNDRKMAKWQGFFLSEHNEELSFKKKERKIEEQQSDDVINKRIYMSFKLKMPIEIQLNNIENNSFIDSFFGVVVGFSEAIIFIETSDSSLITIDSYLIRYVNELKTVKWSK